MIRNPVAILILLVTAILLGASMFFTVSEKEHAVLFRLGEIVQSDFKPGVHFKWPFINNVVKFDRRLIPLDSKPERVLTSEKRNLIVDYFVMWRITNAREYYLAFRGDERRAGGQIGSVVISGLRDELQKRTMRQVVADDRDEIMRNLTVSTNAVMGKFGIEIADVRIKQLELEEKVLDSVFEQMRAERTQFAADLRAKGEKQAKILESEASRKRIEIVAAATRQADIIKGEGDAKASEIYARAYNRDAEFYAFYRSLQGYRNSFTSKDDVIVLEPDSEFFKYFGSSKK
jgi:modulator of FtsH protease HflC